ncbi:MAG: TetR/AcrR family transcriptional regulator [bacterium]|nr:TetR/AcrR family transcriptional regulator [bacterium]
MNENSTKTKILDSAEKLFAEKGISGTSLRSIIAEAGVNLAAVHYHYGSKTELIRAVFKRRFSPINDERINRLNDINNSNGNSPAVEDLIRAFLGPVLLLGRGNAQFKEQFHKLFGQVHSEPEEIKSMFLEQMEETTLIFSKAFHQALPNLSEDEIFWRFRFMIGTMAISIMSMHHKKYKKDRPDPEYLLETLTKFLAGGFRS